jgi:hypothetical protein
MAMRRDFSRSRTPTVHCFARNGCMRILSALHLLQLPSISQSCFNFFCFVVAQKVYTFLMSAPHPVQSVKTRGITGDYLSNCDLFHNLFHRPVENTRACWNITCVRFFLHVILLASLPRMH